LAPTLKQQASAMLTILDRYSWKTFSIVTGKIAGHHNFEIVRIFYDFTAKNTKNAFLAPKHQSLKFFGLETGIFNLAFCFQFSIQTQVWLPSSLPAWCNSSHLSYY
jgi:hypothetical protein